VSGSPGGEILLQDPYHPYAVRFIALARERGVRAVCVYTDAADMARNLRKFPELAGPDVAASYLIEGRTLDDVAAHLRTAHRIVAVVPHSEPTVLPLARLAELLDLPWAQPGVLERFRDKHALKSYLRSVPGGPRINAIAAVRTVGDVRGAIATGDFARYVLKPNDGFGNTTIGFFDAVGDPALLEQYVAERHGAQLLMEEYIGGEEYFVDGQVDADGTVESFAVWKYRREDLNGRRAVSTGDISVRTTDPDFAAIVEYAADVMRATGLRSSPFHLECKVDEVGPCLIEVGARLVGGELAEIDPILHGSLDMIDQALHYYLGSSERLDARLDWTSYDSSVLATVNGISTTTGLVHEIEGQREIEARPDFVRWGQPPRLGARLVPTVDLLNRPWRAVVRLESERDYDRVAAELHATLRINQSSTGARRALRRGLAYTPMVSARIERMRRPPSFVVPLP
jgi:biotin carboxylase